MITDELREYVDGREGMGVSPLMRRTFTAIADRIDEEFEKRQEDIIDETLGGIMKMTDEKMAENGWIRLPKDSDGEYIHIGDMMWQKDRITKRSCKAIMGSEYVMLDGIQGAVYAKKLTHCHKPTVEKLLEEMYDALDDARIPNGSEKRTYEEIIAEYAKKLQLVNDEE